MPAYWIARAKINDLVEYKKYTDRIPAIIAKHGGKVLRAAATFRRGGAGVVENVIVEGGDATQR